MPREQPILFESPAAFRKWLQLNHANVRELLVGFIKVEAQENIGPSITWPESVAEALCFGWIDGIRRRLDEHRYTIRFTPRRRMSKWSEVNVRLFAQLEAEGRMTEAGRAVYEARPRKTEEQVKGYKAQRKDAVLDPARTKEFKMHRAAWKFFEAQPPGYRRMAAWWVMSAKQEAKRDRRLSQLIERSKSQERIA